jgi:hypothetical protein
MGAWEEIVDYTVPSNTTSVTLNNFGEITKDDFIKITYTNISNINSDANINLYPNTSSGVSGFNSASNYKFQILIGLGSNVIADRLTGATLFSSSLNATTYSSTYFKIAENNTVNYFTNGYYNLTLLPRVDLFYTTSTITFPDPITSLTFNSEVTNAIGTGSRIQIYRLAAEKVADIVVSSNTTQVDITGLDIQKGSEYLLVSDGLIGGSSDYWELFVNNNTTSSNYYVQFINGEGTTAAAGRNNLADFSESGSNTRFLTYSHIKLSNIGAYTSQNYSIREFGTSSLRIVNKFISSTAENITSINQLNIRSFRSNGIQSTSRFQLYKLY